MRWLDSCMFNGEDVMKLRLEYLAPHVDKFFVCEQRYTHQGKRKDTLFVELYKDWLDPYKSKVVILVDETVPQGGTWKVENSHRNYVLPFLFAEPGPWICSVCDVDEIPDVAVVKQEGKMIYKHSQNGPVYMQQNMFYYNLNWFLEIWRKPFFISDGLAFKSSNLQQYRDKKDVQMGGLLKCGWHLSYFMSAKEIQRKLLSFAHDEYIGPEWTNLEHIHRCILNGVDLFKRYPQPFQKVPLLGIPPEFEEFHKKLVEQQKGTVFIST
jgi:hypothetical protein